MSWALPDVLRMNAWTGSATPSSALAPSALLWGLKRRIEGPSAADLALGPPALLSESAWQDPSVGWGLVLPENEALGSAERATAVDAPTEIQELLAARQPAPVFRYRSDHLSGFLRRYYDDGSFQDPSLAAVKPGVAKGLLPKYLLIYASPAQIPWRFQYVANSSRMVGRLWLEGQALTNYVTALVDDWKDGESDPTAPLVWSASFGQPDITWLMDAVISQKVTSAFGSDGDLHATSHFGSAATAEGLRSSLAKTTPSLVVTTSHGMTGPLDDVTAMRASLGRLVDVEHALVDEQQLLADWSPNGAIWYAHACCAAGSDGVSRHAGLFDPASGIAQLLSGVAAGCGSTIAPMPTALLGAKRPLRAFVGHVEPTFDWTLRNPETGQPLASSIVEALYNRLYQQGPTAMTIAHALREIYAESGAFLAQYLEAISEVNTNAPQARERALYRQLVAMDRQQMVILGDPTVMLPPLPK